MTNIAKPLILLLLLTSPSHAEIDLHQFSGIPNFVQLDQDIIGGGRPTSKDLQIAANQGIKAVIDLRTPPEGTEAERQTVENLGMKYFSIPVIFPTEAHADELADILADPTNRPTMIHCAVGGRVQSLWELYLKRNPR